MTMTHEEIMNTARQWHYETFIKDAEHPVTLVSQLLKFEEELAEWEEAKNLEELADVFIVLAGLRNLDSEVGRVFETTIYLMGFPLEEVDKEILKKLDINRQRAWKYINGVWHH